MTKLKWWTEFYARLIVWVGAFCFEMSTGWEMIKNSTSLGFTVSLGIVVVATVITGWVDLCRFRGRN